MGSQEIYEEESITVSLCIYHRERKGGRGWGKGAKESSRKAEEVTGTPWSCVLPTPHPTRDRPDLTSVHRLPNRPRSPVLRA